MPSLYSIFSDRNQVPGSFELPLIHCASLFGFEEAVKALIAAGVDINERGDPAELSTPLLCALRGSHSNIVRVLIRHGADCRPGNKE